MTTRITRNRNRSLDRKVIAAVLFGLLVLLIVFYFIEFLPHIGS